MTTAPKNANPTRKTRRNHGYRQHNDTRRICKSKFEAFDEKTSVRVDKKALISKGRKDPKTGVDLLRPEKPPKSMVSQPKGSVSANRGDRLIYDKILVDQTGESLRKLRFRLKTLSKSKSSIEGSCNPFFYLKAFLRKVKNADVRVLQKISNLLVGHLVLTRDPVGISLSKNIQMVVASPSPYITKRIVSCLPFWATSYTMNTVRCIVSLLKQTGA